MLFIYLLYHFNLNYIILIKIILSELFEQK